MWHLVAIILMIFLIINGTDQIACIYWLIPDFYLPLKFLWSIANERTDEETRLFVRPSVRPSVRLFVSLSVNVSVNGRPSYGGSNGRTAMLHTNLTLYSKLYKIFGELSWQFSSISWHTSTVILIPKPSKDTSDPNKYRLIAALLPSRLTSSLCVKLWNDG